MTGEECPKETFAWLIEISRHCTLLENVLLRAVIFSYHCTRLCSHIRKLVDADDLNELLSSLPSILRDLDRVENVTHPLSYVKNITDCVIEPPLASSTLTDKDGSVPGVCVKNYQCSFRMRLSYHMLEFLFHASKAPGCTPQQRDIFNQYRQRCIEEFRVIAGKVLFMLSTILSMDSFDLHEKLKRPSNTSRIIGWSDATRVLWPLRLIASCPVSLAWQRDAAQKVLITMSKKLGIIQALGTLYVSVR